MRHSAKAYDIIKKLGGELMSKRILFFLLLGCLLVGCQKEQGNLLESGLDEINIQEGIHEKVILPEEIYTDTCVEKSFVAVPEDGQEICIEMKNEGSHKVLFRVYEGNKLAYSKQIEAKDEVDYGYLHTLEGETAYKITIDSPDGAEFKAYLKVKQYNQ